MPFQNRSHVRQSLLKISCRVGQDRFERRPTICNRRVSWWAGAAKRRWSHPTPLFQQALANVAKADVSFETASRNGVA